ncbi:beta-N-acetylhexosaminidase [Pasteurellaceae bacterium USgator11]|nr:beta-N-acetylhexosaminidase [Pasteurellaceae bacterium UScroc12]TNG96922.1 beta-N-acetylhexosaminidase [Pasteurellaceae bacterium USgator41]TNG99300.1 beta-N-acetylhexosaminidase [Pasteurellaceae bacterium UScroc31]TNG99380.1 beta-N-acetylhexosaminidase [Pasteurellaceae bacterium USgator11]
MTTLLIDLQAYELTTEEVELLQHPLVAGLILFSRNFHDRRQLQALIQAVRQRVKKPLLITVDQEGGRVQRFREGFSRLPAMQSFALMETDPQQQRQLAQEAGWLMAAEMTALDIDLSFAPVLDLGHQSKAIGDRSFGEDVNSVAALAEAFIDGMAQAGMAATGKHFPGHGHVIADSHLETPIDNRPKETIFAEDVQPFARLINAGKLQAVMPAHVIYNQCDSQPASGSAYWLQTVLRQQLAFDGAIFSDDLGMKGAGFMGDFVERCQASLQAGCDLLLLCNEREGVIKVLDNLQHQATAASQVRLHQLFKRKTIDWNTLQATSRWVDANRTLDRLQQQWLEFKHV